MFVLITYLMSYLSKYLSEDSDRDDMSFVGSI